MWKCLHTNPLLPQAVLVYIKCYVSPHHDYSKVVNEIGELDTVIAELPTKKKNPTTELYLMQKKRSNSS